MVRQRQTGGTWLLCVGISVLTACGPVDAPPRPKPGLPEECIPKSCQSLSATCGTVTDGCGGVLECGTCRDGSACSDQHQCVAVACEKVTCAEAGVNCGVLADRCGGQLQCGSCAQGELCGGGGAPGVCGTGACVPMTCEFAGAQCGELPDGCGGTMACGTCSPGERCGYGGRANVCGQVVGGSIWSEVTDGAVVALALDGTGASYGLLRHPSALELVRISAAGKLEGRVTIDGAVSGGSLFFADRTLFAAYSIGDTAIVTRLEPDGRVRWRKELPGAARSFDVRGERLALVRAPERLTIWHLSGTTLHDQTFSGLSAVSLRTDGGYALGGSLIEGRPGDGPFADRTGAGEAFLLSVSASHQPLWSRVFEGARAEVVSLSAEDHGGLTSALRSTEGTLTWADVAAAAPTVLIAAASAEGAPLWASPSADATTALLRSTGGELSALLVSACSRLERWTTEGRRLWSDPIATGCDEGNRLQAQTLDADARTVLVGGSFTGALDFGEGKVTSDGEAGFLEAYGP